MFYISDKKVKGLTKERDAMRMKTQTLKEQLSTTASNYKVDQEELKNLRSSVRQTEDLLSHLQTENETLKSKIATLNKIADKFNQKTEIVDNSLQYAYKNSLIELKEQKDAIQNAIAHNINDNQHSKGTVTEIYDIDVQIYMEKQTMAQKMMLQTNLEGVLLQNVVT